MSRLRVDLGFKWAGSSGLTNAFPKELALWRSPLVGDLDTARAIYRWFMPLLHPDAEHDLVQSIKLAEQGWAEAANACVRRYPPPARVGPR